VAEARTGLASAAKQLAEKVGSTATLGCALMANQQKTEHRQECLCYKNASEMDFSASCLAAEANLGCGYAALRFALRRTASLKIGSLSSDADQGAAIENSRY
jgi:hypothetical protein